MIFFFQNLFIYKKGADIITEKHIIRHIVAAHQKTQVKASEFFISWNGVPTIAYKGFSPALLQIKEEITSHFSSLCKENPGSKWPKTTLGALHDNKTLSMDDLITLRDICDLLNPELQNYMLHINTLEIVLYYCRSLEKRLFTESIPLANPKDTFPPHPNHLKDISGIMKQFSRAKLCDYLPSVQKPGHRESYYRDPCIKATLIYDLKETPPVITQFRNNVDKKLPGMYCWFNNDSLHMTVRAFK